MKKILLLAVFALSCRMVVAQPWMPRNTTGPVKFSDALARYPQQGLKDNEEAETEQYGVRKEGKDDLFQKWAWYWSHHLDQNGYMVPPVKTLVEWQKYTAQLNAANKVAKTTSVPANWVFQGPHTSTGGYGGIGRINTVAFDPVDSNIFYVGSAAGSTWKTTNGGSTWASCYDNLPTLGVADIKINPLNRNTIYVATGDGDAGDAYSSGVIVSHDGGATWLTTGLTWLPTVYDNARSLLINPLDTSTMLLGTNAGIFKSYNAGATWTNVASGNFKQILYNPADTNIVYGTMYTDTSSQIMRSVNAGLTWNAVTSFTDAQRINIAVCPASPSIVKAVASNNSSGLKGIYSSSDNGATYTAVYTDDTSCGRELLGYDLGLPTTNCGGQGWYDLCIAINPLDPSQVTVGGVNTYYSSDGGASWQIANTWYGGLAGVITVHADKHCLAYNTLSGALFETCDGGIYKNYGPLTAPWIDLSNGICITEFYRNAVDNNVSYCIGGAQDNGTKMIDGGVSTDLTGGDGMQPLINYGDPAHIFYCSYPSGSIDMTRDAGANYVNITDTIHGSGAWVTPYVLHPTDTATLLLGYSNVFVSHNNGILWTPLSPVFDSNANINYLAIAPTNPNYIYAETDNYDIYNSIIHYTTDFGVTWDSIISPASNFISGLVIDPKNEKHFWVTVSGYGTDKVLGYNLATHAWTHENAGLPNLPIDCMAVDSSSRTRYLGTDAAIFYKDTTMTTWALFNTHLPSVHVDDLHINYTTGEIWAATFGRGMWKSVKADTPHHVHTLSVRQITAMAITAAPNPNHGTFTITTSNSELKNGPVTVALISADGKIAWHANSLFDNSGNLKIAVKGLPAGVYICEVGDKALVARTRIVVD